MHSQTLWIDTFNTGAFSLSGNQVFQPITAGGAIGGTRRVALFGGSGSSVDLGSTYSGNLTFHKQDAATTLLLRYGDTGLSYGGGDLNGSDLNLNVSGYNKIALTLTQTIGTGQPPTALTASFYDGTSYGSATVQVNQCCSTFSGDLTGNINWSHIHGIELQLPSPSSQQGTYAIDWVEFLVVVPEPSSYALATGMALLGAAVWHRRHRRTVGEPR